MRPVWVLFGCAGTAHLVQLGGQALQSVPARCGLPTALIRVENTPSQGLHGRRRSWPGMDFLCYRHGQADLLGGPRP
jgi:hypothetical protein